MPAGCPVRIRGQDFPSIVAAAKHYGITRHKVEHALNRGVIDEVPNLTEYWREQARNRHGALTTIRGVSYASMRKAAEALGVSFGQIRAAKMAGRLETLGLGLPIRRRGKPTVIDGVEYISRRAACRALGKSMHQLFGPGRSSKLPKGDHKTLSFLIPTADYEDLRRQAELEGVSLSRLARRYFSAGFANIDGSE